MTTDFCALCAELLRELDHATHSDYQQELKHHARAALAEPEPEGPTKVELRQVFDDQSGYINDEQVMWWSDFHAAARAVLARWGRPAPQPADGEAAERLDRYDRALSAVMPPDFKDWWQNSKDEWPDVAAGVIENLRKREELAWEHVGRLAAQPISVAERLPEPGDCDEVGECYWFDPEGSGTWYQDIYQGNYSHWLPVHALPVPE